MIPSDLVEILFPLHCLTIVGLVAFAALRGSSFPLKLTMLYAAFFYTSTLIEYLNATPELQIVSGFIFASILCNICLRSKRRLYIDLFCLLMVFAILNYILLYFSYIALSGDAYELAAHLYTVAHVLLSIFDIVILIGVANGSGSDRVYNGLGSFISNGLSSMFARMEAPKTYHWPTRSTQTQTGNAING